MNLYMLHDKPYLLHQHDKGESEIPEVFWPKYEAIFMHRNMKRFKEILKKHEDAIAKSPKYSWRYARAVLNKPWPKGEDAIAKSAYYSGIYAVIMLNKPFPKGEEAISKAPKELDAYLSHFPERKEAMEKFQ